EAYQLTRRAARVGFDWKQIDGLFAKLNEEVRELREAIEIGDTAHREEEIGDLLFVGVNLARFLDVNAEAALKKANRKFTRRFQSMEKIAASRGAQLAALDSGELEALWSEAKRIEAHE